MTGMRTMCLLVACAAAAVSMADTGETVLREVFTNPARWKPGPGAGAPEPTDAGLRFPLRFAGNPAERAYWDAAVSLDLADARGIRLNLRSADWLPVGTVTCYFKSGSGWYSVAAASADPAPGGGGWHETVFPLAGASREGSPSGWGRVDTIRLAVWRGADADSALDIALPVVLTGRRDVVLVDSGSPYAAAFDQALAESGVPARNVGESDLTPARLSGARVVILPHNPDLAGAALDAVTGFLNSGGKVVSCFTLPGALLAAMGLRRGTFATGGPGGGFATIAAAGGGLPGLPDQTLQSSWNILQAEPLPGRGHVAATWRDASGADTGMPAIVATDRGAYLSHVLLTDDWTRKRRLALALAGHAAPDLLDVAVAHTLEGLAGLDDPDARDARMRAFALVDEGRATDALAVADSAREAALRARARNLPPIAGEFRGFWCHNPFGAPPLSWDETIASLKRAGFTAVLPNLSWGGLAYYPSKVLPVYGQIGERGDQVKECLDACRRHGVEIHVWKVCWKLGEKAPASFVEKVRREGRTQVRRNGAAEPQWLCPTHPANRALERDALLEIARNYPVDGVHLDYIRYPGGDTCFCAGCKQRFEARLGKAVAGWPGAVNDDPALRNAWLDFRRDTITSFVRELREGLRGVNPAIKLSAAVFPNAPLDRDRIGQDWAAWCRDGLVDFVCPMTYTPLTPQFAAQARQQAVWARPAACYPGIGFSTWRDPENIGRLLDQMQAARAAGTGGFTVFDLKPGVPRTVLPLLAEGPGRGDQQN